MTIKGEIQVQERRKLKRKIEIRKVSEINGESTSSDFSRAKTEEASKWRWQRLKYLLYPLQLCCFIVYYTFSMKNRG